MYYRPDLKTLTISPNPVNAKAKITVTIGVDDVEIEPGTDYKYARATAAELYAGEDGIM